MDNNTLGDHITTQDPGSNNLSPAPRSAQGYPADFKDFDDIDRANLASSFLVICFSC